MNRIRIGVIGCGVIGSKHIEAAAGCPDIELLAVADLRLETARTVAQEHNVPRIYGSADEMLADADVQAIVLAMPTCLRFDLGLKTLAAGKHLLTEKPVAMSTAQVHRLIEAQGNLMAACCSSRLRFLPSTPPAEVALAAGALGSLRVLHCRAVTGVGAPPGVAPPNWRLSRRLNGGGTFVNWGCYDLDYLLGICGWRIQPLTALAQTWSVAPEVADRAAPGSDAETHIAAMIRCAAGVVIHYERAEFAAAQTHTSWSIVGSRASLRLPMLPGEKKQVILDRADPSRGVVSQVLWEGDDDWDTQHFGPIRDFAHAIAKGCSPKTTLRNALVLQQITDAVYASAATGQAVSIV